MKSGRDFDDFLRAARAHRAADASDAARVAARLREIDWDRAVPGPTAPAASPGSASRAAPSRPGRGPWLKLLGGAASVVALGAVVRAVVTTSAPESTREAAPPPAAVPSPPVVTSAGETAEPERSDVPVLADPSLLPAAPAAPSPRRALPRSRATGDEGGSLDAELALLADSNAALRSGDPARALALTAEHARRFPDGALAPEVAAQRVLALAALGRKDEACSEARRFITSNPSSPLLPQVRTACDDLDPRP